MTASWNFPSSSGQLPVPVALNALSPTLFRSYYTTFGEKSKEKGKKLLEVLDSANEVLQSFIKIIMYYAPIGLGAYFAALVGTFGASIAVGYLKTFIIYSISCLIVYFVIYSLYAYLAGGKKGFKRFFESRKTS